MPSLPPRLICGRAVRLVEAGAGLKSRVYPEVARDHRDHSRDRQIINDHDSRDGCVSAGNQRTAHLYCARRHRKGSITFRKCRILDGAPPSGIGRAGGGEMGGIPDLGICAIEKQHAQTHFRCANLVHLEPLQIQGVTRAGIPTQRDIRVPLPVAAASSISIDDGQRMN